jgi:hypothetical protein
VGNFGSPTGDGRAGDDTVVRFTPGQLAASGQPTPAVILRGLNDPYGHVFDTQGSLWVGNNSDDNVLRFPPGATEKRWYARCNYQENGNDV